MPVSVLERDVFTEATAARLLNLPQNTLHYWLEGGTVAGRAYKPVIRLEARGGRPPVTWAEFGVPYPLADRRPYVSGRDLVIEAQDRAGLDAEFCLVAVVRGQQLLLPPSQGFLERVTWDGDEPVGWRPHADPASPVRVFPDRRGGRPSVGGISTEVLWENTEAGADIDEVADMFNVAPDDVRWAMAYETSTRAA